MLVDWSRIESLVDITDPDDRKWLTDMMRTLLENMAQRMTNLGNLINQSAEKDLQSELHQIKGVAANFGLKAMSDVVVLAESLAKSQDWKLCYAESQKIAPLWEQTQAELLKRFPIT